MYHREQTVWMVQYRERQQYLVSKIHLFNNSLPARTTAYHSRRTQLFVPVIRLLYSNLMNSGYWICMYKDSRSDYRSHFLKLLNWAFSSQNGSFTCYRLLAYAESSAILDIRFCVYPTSLLYGEFENSTSSPLNCPKLKLFRPLCLLTFLTHFQLWPAHYLQRFAPESYDFYYFIDNSSSSSKRFTAVLERCIAC